MAGTDESLPAPGFLGRTIRVFVGIMALYFFWKNRHLLKFGQTMTPQYIMNWVIIALGIYAGWTLLTRLLRLPDRLWTRFLFGLLYFMAAGIDLIVMKSFPGPVFTFVGFGVFMVWLFSVGISFLISAVYGTPG